MKIEYKYYTLKMSTPIERDYLETAGFETEIESNGAKGLERALQGGVDAVLLDVMLPGKNGFDICREIRKETNIPIILVTARKEEIDKIRGLSLGADDYLVKPFSPAEMVARVRSHIQIHERLLEQKKMEKSREVTVKNLTIYPEEHRVLLDGEEVAFSNKEYEILIFLVENPNIVFSRERLFDRIWGMEAAGTMATVTVHINRIREKLNKNKENNQFIETVWGAGYRFRMR